MHLLTISLLIICRGKLTGTSCSHPEFETYFIINHNKAIRVLIRCMFNPLHEMFYNMALSEWKFFALSLFNYAHIPLPVIHKCKRAKSTIFCTMKWEFHFTFYWINKVQKSQYLIIHCLKSVYQSFVTGWIEQWFCVTESFTHRMWIQAPTFKIKT